MNVLEKDSGDEDDRAEMESHILHQVDELVEAGIAPIEARKIAEKEFGDPDQIVDRIRTERIRTLRTRSFRNRIDVLRQDLAFAFRQFRRAPGFAAVALLTLMIGIGTTVTIVTVVRAVVLDPLPFSEPADVVFLRSLTPDLATFSVSEVAFLEWREKATTLVGVAAFTGRGATLLAPGQPTSIERGYVNAGFFAVLGNGIEFGREFIAEEDAPAAALPVALISHGFWVERFGSAQDVLGKTVDLNGEALVIVGVLQVSMSILFGDIPVITPLGASRSSDAGDHALDVLARIRPQASVTQATAELQTITSRLSLETGEDQGWSVRTQSVEDGLIGDNTQKAGWVLLIAAALLLATACLNVSNLLLARASARTTEIGIRNALGAGKGRILGQLLTESAVLAAIGGVLGVGLTAVALPVVRSLGAGNIPRLEGAVFSPGIILVSGAAIFVAVLAFGAAPMMATRGTLLLSSNARGRTTQGTGTRRLLVVAQIAVSLVLLVGTGLLSRSFLELSKVDPGFEPVGAVAISIQMPPATYDPEERIQLLQSILANVEALPEVERAGATATDPFSGSSLANFVARRDQLPTRTQDFTAISWRIVTPGLFEAMGVDLLAGRTFVNADLDAMAEDGLAPTVIGDRLARTLYGSAQQALGKVLVWGDRDGSHHHILGVVEDLVDVDLSAQPAPMIYQLHARVPWATMNVIARVRPGAEEIGNKIRRAVSAAAPGIPTPEVQLLESTLDRTLAEPRFNFVLIGSFAVAGLLLAVVGIYALTTFEVQQRFREIGIRLALGARPAAIQQMIMRERAILGATGIGVGLIVALFGSRYVESLLFGITTSDPYTWGGVILLLSVTVGFAGYFPARRATKVDPREVLQRE